MKDVNKQSAKAEKKQEHKKHPGFRSMCSSRTIKKPAKRASTASLQEGKANDETRTETYALVSLRPRIEEEGPRQINQGNKLF